MIQKQWYPITPTLNLQNAISSASSINLNIFSWHVSNDISTDQLLTDAESIRWVQKDTFSLTPILLYIFLSLLNNSSPFSFLGTAIKSIDLTCLLLFIGAMGKSAQIFLHTWLPDAMEGPTPVSALIHAATMVTSGVYLFIRVNPIMVEASTWSTGLIAWVGVGTALFAASIAVAQTDIKKVLAYHY